MNKSKLNINTLNYLIEKWKPRKDEIKNTKVLHQKNMSFNVFKIFSNRYYLEDFHSRMIGSILKRKSPSKNFENLRLFIELLNYVGNKKGEIDVSDFQNPIIELEKGRVDISIRDKVTEKVIIIENKMNGAVDQEKQLYRYYNYHEIENKRKVVAIVYLPLIEGKTPNMNNWLKSEKKTINDLLVNIPAYSNTDLNLINNWIEKCAVASNELHFVSTLLQYKDLIIDLTKRKIISIKMTDFYDIIDDEDKYETLLSMRDMLNQLNKFRAIRIRDKFSEQKAPFEKIGILEKSNKTYYVAKFENNNNSDKWKKYNLWLRIECHNKHSVITLIDNTEPRRIERFLKEKNLSENFSKEVKYHTNTDINEHHKSKEYFFPKDEKELYNDVEDILSKLNEFYNSETNQAKSS